MEPQLILEKVKLMATQTEFVNYIEELLQQNYGNKEYIIPILNDMYNIFQEPQLFAPILLTFMLDLDRKKVFGFTMQHDEIYNIIFPELLNSEHYMHRLALAEMIGLKERNADDIEVIKVLLKDKIDIVKKAAIHCVDENFDQELIISYIDKFMKSSYQLESACVKLLKYVKHIEKKNAYFRLLIKSQNWAVRYHLTDIVHSLDLPVSEQEKIYRTLSEDLIEEVQIKFIKTFSQMQNTDIKHNLVTEILCRSSDRVKLKLLDYLQSLCNIEGNIDARYITYLINILNESNVDLKIKGCEILCSIPYVSVNRDLPIENELNMETKELEITEKREALILTQILSSFNELIVSSNWRIRIRLLTIIEKFDANYNFFITKLKQYMFRFMCDKVEEIRVTAKNVFIKYNKKFVGKLYEDCFDEIKCLVLSKKYHVRLVAADIVKRANLVDECMEVKYKELFNFLMNDSVDVIQEYMCCSTQ